MDTLTKHILLQHRGIQRNVGVFLKGDTMTYLQINLTEKVIKRFWAKVNKKSEEECWGWEAYKDAKGYGQMRINYKRYGAHRISWLIHNGEIPEHDSWHGMCVCHTCDNPGCVNPSHMFLGTQQENVKDMRDKGRGVLPDNRGERQGSHKLTEKQVREIREKYTPHVYTQYKLAKEYGVSESTVHYIVNYVTWESVTEPVIEENK